MGARRVRHIITQQATNAQWAKQGTLGTGPAWPGDPHARTSIHRMFFPKMRWRILAPPSARDR